jgi:hypothetical protein
MACRTRLRVARFRGHANGRIRTANPNLDISLAANVT